MPLAILTLLSALSLAAVAGWFSIVGFMAIYAGAPMYALIMGVVTECAKLVTTSWLYRNWKYAGWGLKAPLLYFTIALMTATSIGVFGFLSKAHIEQGADKIDNSAKIESLNYQINREKGIIADNEKVIAQLDTTVNSLLGKDRADRALAVRKSQMAQRKQLQDDSAAAQKRIDELSKEKFTLESEVRKLQLDVGPIRYIAELIYGVEENANKNIEAAVRIFTLLIVSTLDPLAVILLIAANHTLLRLRREKEEAKIQKSPNILPEVNEPPSFADNKIGSEEIKVYTENGPEHGIPFTERNPQEEKTFPQTIFPEIVEPVNEDKENLVLAEVETTRVDAPVSVADEEVSTDSSKEESNTVLPERESETSVEEALPPGMLDEIKNTTLAKFLASRGTAPVPVVRSPSITLVSREEIQAPAEPAEEIPAVEEKKEIHNSQGSVTPWAQQETVLRELLGTTPHFTPVRINEENKAHNMEESARPKEGVEAATQTGLQEESTVEKVHTETSSQDQTTENIATETDVGNNRDTNSAADKYPKALGWINEFRGN